MIETGKWEAVKKGEGKGGGANGFIFRSVKSRIIAS